MLIDSSLINGITEIVGDPGVGKTKMAIFLFREFPSIYLSNSKLTVSSIPENMLIRKLNSFLELKIFIHNRLKDVIKQSKIKHIILDGLDRFLYTIEKPRSFSNDISVIAKILKNLVFRYQIKIIVINNYFSGWTVDNCLIYNKYLGIGWSYVPNIRFLITKNNFNLRRMKGIFRSKIDFEFRIENEKMKSICVL